jgi:hypothetical protein
MIEENDSLEDMDIRHVKLSDGSDIIAYINSVEGSSIVVERPMNLNLVTTANGFDTYFFTKYFPFAKDNLVKLNSRNIISASEVTSEIKEKYLQSAIRTDSDSDIDNSMNDLDEEDMNLNFMESPSKKYH